MTHTSKRYAVFVYIFSSLISVVSCSCETYWLILVHRETCARPGLANRLPVLELYFKAFKNICKLLEACFSYEEGPTIEVQSALFFDTTGVIDATLIQAVVK